MLAVRSAKGLHRWTYYCIFGLLAVTGLRIGEALRLKHGDVDLGAGLLTIRDTKFGKSRLVPVHSTTVAFRDRKSHTSELQSLMRISYAVFCLKKKNIQYTSNITRHCIIYIVSYIRL